MENMTPPHGESHGDRGFAPVIESEAGETGQRSHGERTLVRNSNKHVTSRNDVPSTTSSPENRVASKSETNKNKQTNPETPGPKTASGSRVDFPQSTTNPIQSTGRPNRLASAKSWQPDALRRTDRRLSFFRPSARRAGTSYLDRAIWESSAAHRRRDSSESSNSLREVDSPDNDGEDRFKLFSVGNQNYNTSGKVKKDGRLRITVNETANTGYLAKALGAALTKVAPPVKQTQTSVPDITVTDEDAPITGPRPRLNIVIMVIGSRGDAQPFLKIGKVLKEQYGHRVRIATHPAFRDFVEKDSGLEFFSVGGDPAELMAFMVKSPGLIPTLDSVIAGDIGRRRAAMAEMFDGFWRACINATDDEKDSRNLKMMGEKDPFVADTIIANPPSFAHIHCAEALGIPLHLMFTFPYTPTQAFPHPLASIKKSNVDPGYTNFISYPLVEMMVWQGLGDLVNDFRVKTLCLDPMSTLWAPGATYRLHVPFSYLWSPELVPKPEDWGNEIDISGFVFLDLASTFEPPKELEDFLNAGEAPIYIGFGSIVVDDPDHFTNLIFEAVKMAGVRALVSKGWGGLGGDEVPDNVFMLDNTPHDWLFPRVKACVIHGGAGTTAIALKCGKPTMVVPFFGDQHFWGQMLGTAGVGPDPVPYKDLDAEKLAEGIKYCLTNEAQVAADKMAQSIDNDGDGAGNAVKQFHHQLDLRGPSTMRCSILKDQTAVWKLKDSNVRLSALAADVLVGKGLLSWKRLRLIRHVEWNDFEGPGEPVTGVAGSIAKTFGEAFRGIVSVPYRIVKRSKQHKQRKTKAESTKRGKKSKQQEGPGTLDRSGSETSEKAINAESIPSSRTKPYVGDVARGVERTATAIAKAPADLSLALAQGFHNAPRLYGDDTVRRPPRVTGIRSGLRAARFELIYGVYDGFTGVVRLPVHGARNDGVVGFVKGVGMGLTGLVLKNLAAIVGPFGYTLKGVVKQAERSKRPDKFIRRARIEQGRRDFKELSEQHRREVTKQATEGWLVMKDICDILGNLERQNGLAGKIDHVLLDTGSLFEDVDTARKALEELRRGETLENVLNKDERGRANEEDKSDGRRSRSIRRSLNIGKKRIGDSNASASHGTQEGG